MNEIFYISIFICLAVGSLIIIEAYKAKKKIDSLIPKGTCQTLITDTNEVKDPIYSGRKRIAPVTPSY
jgi:hypothetical protein